MKNLIEEKLKKRLLKIKFKFLCIIFTLSSVTNLFSYEIIRDPIFEDYFSKISKNLKLKELDVYLINNMSANAFVIEDKVYFTTGLLNVIKNEDTLKAIYLHEYGHVMMDHFQAKNINIKQSNNKNTFFNLFAIGLAAISGNTELALGTTITLNSNLVNEISQHSIDFEIEADNFMIDQIKKNEIDTFELISFINDQPETRNNYFSTHPRSDERVNNLVELDYKQTENSTNFEWIKSKYSKKSNNYSFNLFFQNLEKGIFNRDQNFDKVDKLFLQYEAFKKGFFIDNWSNKYYQLLKINDNAYLKIEYINYLLDNNYIENYYLIEDLKFDKKIMKEYFYSFIYGKYYNKIGKSNLSNFYFCQFYKSINSMHKADFFCKKYDIKDIPTLDKSYAIFK